MNAGYRFASVVLLSVFAVPPLIGEPDKETERYAIESRLIEEVRNSSGALSPTFSEYEAYGADYLLRLKATDDLELRRRFALTVLSGKIEAEIEMLELNQIREAKTRFRKMTKGEREDAIVRISALMSDARVLDPDDPLKALSRLAARFEKAQK